MKAKSFALTAIAAIAMTAGGTVSALARDTIQIAGSSTVLPFASIVAEEFGNAFPQFKAPVVGSGGTGGGLRQFCQGVGDNTIDIANASRPMKSAEIDGCNKAGVTQILEVPIGYDGIVFASRADKAAFALTPRHIFAAAAAQVPRDGKLIANPYTRWSQIDAALSDQDIVLIVPAGNHGTREVFEEKILHAGCQAYDEIRALKDEEKQAVCTALRQDGRIVEISGDYTETLARLDVQADALGVFGLSFYEQNRDRLQVAAVNGVMPGLETIASGQYPVSRPLYFYVKGEHIGLVPGLEQYTEYFLNEQMSGTDSPLEQAGLIPLAEEERERALSAFKARNVVAAAKN